MSYFEPGSFEYVNAGEPWSASDTSGVMRFEVRAGDNYSGDAEPNGSFIKERSEISSEKHLNANRTYTIHYQFMVESGAPNTSEWVVIGQLHQTSDPTDEVGVPPPFAVVLYGEELVFVARSNDDVLTPVDVDTVLLNDPIPIERDQWYDIEIQIRFDYRDPATGNAFVKVYLDGVLVVDNDDIAIGYNDSIGPYWQMGVYRESADEALAVNYKDFDITSAEPPPDIVGKEGVNDTLIAYGWESERLYGLSGNDWLDGKQRADRMVGGAGNDTYIVEDVGDVVIENSNEGSDTVRSYVSFTLGNNVETLDLEGDSRANLNGSGNELNNFIYGTNGVNTLKGGSGNDSLYGYEGNDSLSGDADDDYLTAGGGNDTASGATGNDRLLGEAGADILDGGDGNDSLYGGTEDDTLKGGSGIDYLQGDAGVDTLNGDGDDDKLYGIDGNDILNGGSGNDRLDGGTGADKLTGGDGNDSYVVDNVGDQVFESNVAGSVDSVSSSVTFSIASAFVENLTLTGTANINATGNDIDNKLSGNSGANALAGAGGADMLLGYAGNDTLDGGNGNDRIYGDIGNDILKGGADADYLQGDAGDDALYGEAGDDRLYGSDGGDYLDGGSEVDTLDGGTGNDTLKGQDGNDSLYGGTDKDLLSGGNGVDYLQGDAGDDTLYGEAGDDRLYGNDGVDYLDGGSESDRIFGGNENDRIIGGSGNDSLYGDSGNDTLEGGSGIDYVQGDVGNDTLKGDADDDKLYGNDGTDTLDGGSGNDRLDGGAGADTMAGGEGNDTYEVDNVGDRVIEANITGSVDTINSSVTFSIVGQFVENLTLTGTANINATGNNLDNAINGNQGANVIVGGIGIDRLNGKQGDDAFLFKSLSEAGDRIYDFTSDDPTMGDDVIQLENSGFGSGVGTGSAASAGVDLVFGTSAKSLNETLIYNETNGQLIWDENGTATGGQTIICTLTTTPHLVADDFVFV